MTSMAAARSARPKRIFTLGSFHIRVEPRALTVALVLLVLTVVVLVISLTTGDYPISPIDVVRTLLGDGTAIQHFIVETLRLPRAILAMVVGAALGIGGAIFQSVSRNPLGSPDIIGFDAGAATGAVVVLLVLHGSQAATSLGALIGGVGTALAVYLLAMKRGVQGYRLILVGIGIAAMLTSVNSYLLTRAKVTEAQQAAVWLTGSLNGRGWEQVRPVCVALVVLVPLACMLGRSLRMLELGDDTAGMLGVPAEGIRLASIVVGVGLAATATAAAGPIGFVALAAPQITRRLTRAPGPNVLVSAICGALLLSASDLVAQRVLPSTQLPVGIVTGVIGGIYLAWLLSREWRKRLG